MTDQDTSGFYKRDGDLLYAPNFVYGPNNFELIREFKDSYQYPRDGWWWFDSIEDAEAEI